MGTEILGLRFAERLLALTSIPLLLWIGYKLFVLGVTGQMTITGTYKKAWSVKLTQVAPGTFCFILGVVLALYTLHANVLHYGMDQTIQSALAGHANLPGPDTARPNQVTPAAGTSKGGVENIAQGKTQLVVDYLNGPNQWPLSFRIRYALSQRDICKASLGPVPSSGASDKCDQMYYGLFSHIPKDVDISRIEKEEIASSHGSSEATKTVQDEANAIEVHQ